METDARHRGDRGGEGENIKREWAGAADNLIGSLNPIPLRGKVKMAMCKQHKTRTACE
ncbi:hypothetical protein DPMN_133101 [Dreissena polymorpha]|uniref:Uncharacterized protein n=1 Tax=Dreissena polymorpha TaxID=45954 RepID=A0A9D4FUZ9_DREPO|nr:hypothetical protein DPMN_133101 [Dreissena polymorpha]